MVDEGDREGGQAGTEEGQNMKEEMEEGGQTNRLQTDSRTTSRTGQQEAAVHLEENEGERHSTTNRQGDTYKEKYNK